MSGHSKWHNIQAKKGKADAQRGAVFTKIGREIAIAVREGGANPESNGKLRDIIAKAKANNMPNDNIQRSIKKASGELSNVVYEEITYEGYAPGGVAVIVDTISDNRNRTASDVRHCFAKYGGNLGTTGSVGFMFDERGVLVVEREPGSDEDEMMMIALDAGAEDVKVEDDVFEILTAPNDFSTVRENLEKQGYTFLSAEVQKIPQNTVAVTDPDTIQKIQKMLDLLEENDDVQNVFHNADLPDEDEDED
jgi:YebC/PmpR family DNA-binding regulatory protein